MSLLKKWGLVKDDEIKQPPKAPATTKPVLTPVPSQTSFSDVDPSDEKIIEDALNACDLPGPDFLEYYNALEGMKDIPIAEPQKYQAAFNSLKTMKLTKDIIISTSVEYMKELENQGTKFAEAKESSMQAKVTDKRNEAEKLRLENISLQTKMQDNITKMNNLNGDALLDEQKINMREQSFVSALERARVKIATIITNVNNYLT